MVHYEQSYQFGKSQESRILPVITEFFKREVQEYPDRYAHHDFFDAEYDYELKSRTNNLNAYPDTMITMNKLQELTKPLILLFNYKDCLCYIKYDEDRFAGYRKQMFARSQRDCDKKEHIFIPITDLEVIGKWEAEKNPAYKSSNGF
jgi:hypothetical protein